MNTKILHCQPGGMDVQNDKKRLPRQLRSLAMTKHVAKTDYRVTIGKIIMGRVQIISFLIVLGVIACIFWVTQQDTLTKMKFFDPQPTISLPPETISIIPSVTPQGGQQQPQAQGQQQEVQGPPKEDMRASISATIRTNKGMIKVDLYNDVTHEAVKNFIKKSNAKFYNNLTFHRVEDWVIQGGDPKGNGTGGGVTVTELNDRPFTTGSLGYAASDNMQVGQDRRVSNDSQFFITKSDASWLSGKYTNFGIVTSGMDVVNKIVIGDKILGITVE